MHLNKVNNCQIVNSVDVHMTTISILNFVSTKNLVLYGNWWTLWAIYLFLPKTYIRNFLPSANKLLMYSSQVQYRDSYKCFRLSNKLDHCNI